MSVTTTRRWVAETISSLKINAIVFYLKVGLEANRKVQKLEKKFFEKELSFKLGLDVYKGQKQGRNDKTQNNSIYYGLMGPSFLASNIMHLHPYFTLFCAS